MSTKCCRGIVVLVVVMTVVPGLAVLHGAIQPDPQQAPGTGLWPIDSLHGVRTVGVGLVEVPWSLRPGGPDSRLVSSADDLAGLRAGLEQRLRQQRIRVATPADGVVYLVVNYRKVSSVQYVYSVRLQFVMPHPRSVSGGATYEIERLGLTVEKGLRPMAVRCMHELLDEFARDCRRANDRRS